MKKVYIVICYTIFNGDFSYHIDSVWMSNKKAINRKNELNTDKLKKWREDYNYGIFSIEEQWISK